MKIHSAFKQLFLIIKSHQIIFEASFIGLFALVLRVINLESWPRWYVDEGALGLLAENIGKGTWGYTTWGPNFFPPLIPTLTTLMLQTFGKTFFAIRLLGALAGSLSSILLYFTGKKLYNSHVGITAALIWAVASVHINRLSLKHNFVAPFFLLTILCYLSFKETKQQRWIYLAGISAGLAFLSRYEGILAQLFLIFQSLLDKKLQKVWKSFPIFFSIAFISPLMGLIIDWNAFLFDTFAPLAPLGQEGFSISNSAFFIFFGKYSNQLGNVPSPLSGIWSAIGIVSLAYILLTIKVYRKFFGVWFISTLPVFILIDHWWVYLVEIYPIYSLATAIALYRIMQPSTQNQKTSNPRKLPSSPKKTRRLLFATFLLTTICFAMILELIPIFIRDEAWDQRAIVNWINTNVEDKDTIAASFPIIFMMKKGVGIPYQDVVLYTTHQSFREYRQEMLLRYKMNVSLQTINYFIVDTPLYGFEPGRAIAETIKTQWVPIFKVGDYAVYRNPQFL